MPDSDSELPAPMGKPLDAIAGPPQSADSTNYHPPDSKTPIGMDDRPPLNWLRDEAPPADADAKLARCQEVIGYTFINQNLLRSALTHASGASHRLASNERLEFLGDAVLGMIVCQWLYEEYPEYNEGELTKIKSAVVSRRSCGKVARRLGLDQCLIVGRGVTKNRSFPQSLVSDVFEAVIAAIYLEAGFDAVRDRLKEWLLPEVNLAVDTRGSGNHKSVLQQYAQRELGATPVYRLLQEVGPDHRKAFLMSAIIDTQTFSPAWGSNKKDAEQRAAANALAILHGNPPPFSHDDIGKQLKPDPLNSDAS